VITHFHDFGGAAMSQSESISFCLQAHKICRSIGTREIISEVSLDINKQEIFGFLGPSGSGKTTRVKMLAGIDKATRGEITLLGRTLPNLSMMKKIGYMAQSDALYHDLTAKENLDFFGSLFGLRGQHLMRRQQEVMELVDLQSHAKKMVQAYSGGMKRRLSLAIALMHEPEVLILDEPTVGIDPSLRLMIWNELYRLCRSGVTILLTTHVMDEAEKCHRLGMILDGRLIATGTPEELKQTARATTMEETFLYYGGIRK